MYEAPKSVEEYLKGQNRYLGRIAGGDRVSALGDKELLTKPKRKGKQSTAPERALCLVDDRRNSRLIVNAEMRSSEPTHFA
jgi:hypothetical protein